MANLTNIASSRLKCEYTLSDSRTVSVDYSSINFSDAPQKIPKELLDVLSRHLEINGISQLEIPVGKIEKLDQLKQQLQIVKDDGTRDKLVACLKAAALTCLLVCAVGGVFFFGLGLGLGLAVQGICLLGYVVGSIACIQTEIDKDNEMTGSTFSVEGVMMATMVLVGGGIWIPPAARFTSVSTLEKLLLDQSAEIVSSVSNDAKANNTKYIEQLATRTPSELKIESDTMQERLSACIKRLQNSSSSEQLPDMNPEKEPLEDSRKADAAALSTLQQKLLAQHLFDLQIREQIIPTIGLGEFGGEAIGFSNNER